MWRTDNWNAVQITAKGSMVSVLHDLITLLHEAYEKYEVRVYPEWISRTKNTLADRISKLIDNSNWSVNRDIFMYFDKNWGPYSCDRFADNSNTKCRVFNSKYRCPGTSGVDCFKYDWGKDNNWLVPPIELIGATLSHMKSCSAKGTLVVPKWTSAYFWPLISEANGVFKPFIKDSVEYVRPKNFFKCTNSKSVFNNDFKSNVVVVKISFDR